MLVNSSGPNILPWRTRMCTTGYMVHWDRSFILPSVSRSAAKAVSYGRVHDEAVLRVVSFFCLRAAVGREGVRQQEPA